jgi:hypothetical protein
MNAARRTENQTVLLRLKMTTMTTDELQQILLRRDPANPRQYLHDAKTRRAAEVVLNVRREG